MGSREAERGRHVHRLLLHFAGGSLVGRCGVSELELIVSLLRKAQDKTSLALQFAQRLDQRTTSLVYGVDQSLRQIVELLEAPAEGGAA